MKCTKCQYYSYSLRTCVLGKINPRTIKGGADAVRIMGPSYICGYCDLRQKIFDKALERAIKENKEALNGTGI